MLVLNDPPVGRTLQDIEEKINEKIERQEEGLVLKDLASKWMPNERQGRTLFHFSVRPEPFLLSPTTHLSTCRLDLSRFRHCNHPRYTPKSAYVELKSGRV